MSHPASSTPGAAIVCWSDPGFTFPHRSDLLVDAGIFIARFDLDDDFHHTVVALWTSHIETPAGTDIPDLWVTDMILNEFMHRAYENADKSIASPDAIRSAIGIMIEDSLQSGALNHTSSLGRGANPSIAISLFLVGLNGADAFHAAEMKAHGFDLLTVDLKLAKKLAQNPFFAGSTVYVPTLPR